MNCEMYYNTPKICDFMAVTNSMVGKTGFEPATSWSQTTRTTKLCYFPNKKMVRPKGFEPLTF